MIELDAGVAEQLTQVNAASSIQVRVGTSNSFLVIASMLQPLVHGFGMSGVYICATRSAVEVIQMFEQIGIDASQIVFIDTVSAGFIGGTEVP